MNPTLAARLRRKIQRAITAPACSSPADRMRLRHRERTRRQDSPPLSKRELAELNPTYHGIGMSLVSGNTTIKTKAQAEQAITGLIGPSRRQRPTPPLPPRETETS